DAGKGYAGAIENPTTIPNSHVVTYSTVNDLGSGLRIGCRWDSVDTTAVGVGLIAAYGAARDRSHIAEDTTAVCCLVPLDCTVADKQGAGVVDLDTTAIPNRRIVDDHSISECKAPFSLTSQATARPTSRVVSDDDVREGYTPLNVQYGSTRTLSIPL